MSIKDLSPALQLADFYLNRSERFFNVAWKAEKENDEKMASSAKRLARKYAMRAKLVLA